MVTPYSSPYDSGIDPLAGGARTGGVGSGWSGADKVGVLGTGFAALTSLLSRFSGNEDISQLKRQGQESLRKRLAQRQALIEALSRRSRAGEAQQSMAGGTFDPLRMGRGIALGEARNVAPRRAQEMARQEGEESDLRNMIASLKLQRRQGTFADIGSIAGMFA